MATRKTTKTPSSKSRKPAGRKAATKSTHAAAAGGRTYKPLAGKARLGGTFDPNAPTTARAAQQQELMLPRPKMTSRYPISNEEFEALKAGAPRARLAAATATRSKDAPKRGAAARAVAPMSPEAMVPGAEPAAAPVLGASFAGIAATGWFPPDCTMAAGPSHVLLSVNSSMAIYTKTGTLVSQRTLTQWFGTLASGLTVFDPKALYDQHAGRWVLLAVGVSESPKASVHLLSVSATSNPTGTWRNYKLDAMRNGTTLTNNWADFPALGVDAQALYITSNMFAFGGGFQTAKVRVVPKTGPYSGGTATFFDFVNLRNGNNSVAFTVQPCHTYGAPQVEYLVNTAFPSGNFVTVWRIVNGGTAPTMTRTQVTVSPYSLAPNAQQKGGGTPLNTGDVRVLHAVFRGDSIWTSFTTAHSWGAGANRAAVQWCQIRAATPAVVQQGVFGASSGHYYYPAACPDNNGNMTMVFSRSGTAEYGSVLYTGRRATDLLGTLQGSAVLKAGVASYVRLDNGGRNRWGDYNGVASDPANPRLVWLYGEFASATNTWATWVGSAGF
jgi:hypothetical protein